MDYYYLKCKNCNDEMEVLELPDDLTCWNCGEIYEIDFVDWIEPICHTCNGSGEDMTGHGKCWSCGGNGDAI